MSLRRAVFAVKRTAMLSSRARYRDLTAAEKLTPEALEALQIERTLAHVRFAVNNTVFYRDRYRDAGITAADLHDPAVLSALPIIEKSDVRDNFELFKSTEATSKNSAVSATGGSTGQPLRLLRDLRAGSRALEWRLFDWWGIHPSDDSAIVYRRLRDERESLKHRIVWWPTRKFQLDAFQMNDTAIDEFIETWTKLRPRLLLGYVGGVVALAEHLEARGMSIPAPRAIAVTAAPLFPNQRDLIEKVLKAPVYDHYRSAEIPWMAGECEHRDGLHVFSDIRRLELVDENDAPTPAGETGQVVITDLTNRVFPMIRYRLGDRTSLLSEPCACGRPFPRVRSIAGRQTEAFRLPSGRVVPGEALAQIFSKTPTAVRQFQVHQLTDSSVVIRVVGGVAPDWRETVDRVVHQVTDLLGHEVPTSLEILDRIPHDGGKIRYVRSDVS